MICAWMTCIKLHDWHQNVNYQLVNRGMEYKKEDFLNMQDFDELKEYSD